MYTYASLAQLRNEIKAETSSFQDDDLLLDLLRQVTRRLENESGYSFVPTIATEWYNARGAHIVDAGTQLLMRKPLLAITALTFDAVALTAWNRNTRTGYYYLINGGTQYSAIGRYNETWYSSDPVDAISVTGVWGVHHDYDNAWTASGATVTDNINSSVTSIAVNNAHNLAAGQVIRIDSEYMIVTSAGTAITVTRGALGSTAASHNSSTSISIWQTERDIQRACYRWAAYLYAMRGSFARTTYDGLATTEYPADMPPEIKGILEPYTRYLSIIGTPS